MNLKEELQESNKAREGVSMYLDQARESLIRAAENQETSLLFYEYDELLIDNLRAEGLTVSKTLGSIKRADYIRATWKNY